MHFWAPQIDPAHPMECTQAERYAVRWLDNDSFVGMNPTDERVMHVKSSDQAYLFHTHDAALRVALEFNRNGMGPVDVVKVEWEAVHP